MFEFGPRHYVPILRWKQAERFALRYLREEDRERITPLIELTPTLFRPRGRGGRETRRPEPGQVLEHEAKKLLEACSNWPFFLDPRYVTAEVPRVRNRIHALEYLAEIARAYKLALIPVTGLSRPQSYQPSVRGVLNQDGRGICLRITPPEALRDGFANDINNLLKTFGLEPQSVHLLLDCQAGDPAEPGPRALLARVPDLNKWQTLVLASGAFPPDLQWFDLGNTKIPRTDWLLWKSTVFHEGGGSLRKPAFSDYTIQYGLYKEPVEGCNPSASIRYTLDEEWLIMRGEALRGRADDRTEIRPGREQWIAHAQILCDDPHLFYGEEFSWGDRFIHERSMNGGSYGSPEIWLRAGINHHMTVVSRQLASLDVA